MGLGQQAPIPYEARFQRFECKYLITESMADRVRGYIQPFVKVDPHATGTPDQSYNVTSLYLDAPDLKLFWESREGKLHRIKLRIRQYGRNGTSPVFLEIKRRHDRLVLKGRARLGRDAVAALLAGGVPDISGLPVAERECYEEFVGWVARWLAQPVIWVSYRREAFVGDLNPGVRVTLDRDLVCAPAADGNGSLPDHAWRPLESRGVILELKFDASFPGWMRRLVQSFELKQRSYSKYGNAVLRGLDPWLLPAGEGWSLPLP